MSLRDEVGIEWTITNGVSRDFSFLTNIKPDDLARGSLEDHMA